MLTANHNRKRESNRVVDQTNVSTQYGGSKNENQSQISENNYEIESKFMQKKKKMPKSSSISKMYKEDDELKDYYTESKYKD